MQEMVHSPLSPSSLDVLRFPPEYVVPGVLRGIRPGKRNSLHSPDEEEVARWLVSHPDALDQVLGTAPTGDASAATVAGQSPGEVLERFSRGELVQVRNDLRDLLSDEPATRITDTIHFTLQNAGINERSRVLEVGCSLGLHLLHLVPRSPLLLAGLDSDLLALALGSAAWARHNIGQPMLWTWGDALDLPFRDSVFTHYNCFVTLSLLPIRRALAEAARVLVPCGRLTITIEGFGFWLDKWETTTGLGRARLARLRELLAFFITGAGAGWQTVPLLRRLSGHTVFSPRAVQGIVAHAGFDVEKCAVLRQSGGQPRLIALTATKAA
ncbi:MAG TPA: methyltransferase domain-containing protein [Candidatus Binatia bacterium]|nr:methyltransferase domain-containing protein [Candidatus Binatia bacterium]